MPDRTEPLYGWIDESGDPSVKPSSTRWFAMVLVLETGPPGALAEAMAEINRLTPSRIGAPAVPHFRTLRPRLKRAAHDLLAAADFTLIAAAVDTRAVSERNPLRFPKVMYAHALSAVIDEAASRPRFEGRSLEVAVEDSPNLDLSLLRKPASAASRASAFQMPAISAFPPANVTVRPAPKHSDIRLGAADGIANALFGALEYADKGRKDAAAHASIHMPKLLSGADGDAAESGGLIVLPAKRAPQVIASHPWLAKVLAG